MKETSTIKLLCAEAEKIEAGVNPVSTYRQSNEFDHDGENICYVLSIHRSGYAELLLPSRTIVKAFLPQKDNEQIHKGNVLAIVVETGMSPSWSLSVNIKDVKTLGGLHNECTKKVC